MDTLITNIGQLVTPAPLRSVSGPSSPLVVREHAHLLLRDGRIESISATPPREATAAEIDAKGGVVLPGWIDPHTHYPAAADAGTRIGERLRRAVRSGITTVEVKCAHLQDLSALAGIVRSEPKSLPAVVPSLFGEPQTEASARVEAMAGLIGDAIPTVRRRRLAEFFDVACGEAAYSSEEARTILRAARAGGLRLKIHAMSRDGDALGSVPTELGVTAVGHAPHLGDRAIALWKKLGIVPVLVPGDALIGEVRPPDPRRWLDAGLAVGLGTNAGGGSKSVGSMWLVLALAIGEMGLSLEQAIAAATLHNAHAIEAAADVGAVEVGKRADLILLDIGDYRELLGALGEEPIRAVVRGGEVVHER